MNTLNEFTSDNLLAIEAILLIESLGAWLLLWLVLREDNIDSFIYSEGFDCKYDWDIIYIIL